MLKLENTEVMGWEHAIRGMRNPKNSWDRSDSYFDCATCLCRDCINENEDVCGHDALYIGPNDHSLMMSLAKGGPVHAKYRRMITVYVDITAPLYWWKEFDTYKVGTVANSCSTMHKIHAKEFTLEDFSCEHLFRLGENADFYELPTYNNEFWDAKLILQMVIKSLNFYRMRFIKYSNLLKEANDSDEAKVLSEKQKHNWWQMIQLLPSSYNQKRTVMLNYEVLAGIYPMRKDHKLDCWHTFCDWIEKLPYSELITGLVERGSLYD